MSKSNQNDVPISIKHAFTFSSHVFSIHQGALLAALQLWIFFRASNSAVSTGGRQVDSCVGIAVRSYTILNF